MSGILLVLSRCDDPEREAEWRAWYDGVHIPHVLENGTPGLDGARRYENPKADDDEPRSAALYDMSGDPVEVFDGMQRRMAERRAAGSTYTIDCLDVVMKQTYRKLSRTEAPAE